MRWKPWPCIKSYKNIQHFLGTEIAPLRQRTSSLSIKYAQCCMSYTLQSFRLRSNELLQASTEAYNDFRQPALEEQTRWRHYLLWKISSTLEIIRTSQKLTSESVATDRHNTEGAQHSAPLSEMSAPWKYGATRKERSGNEGLNTRQKYSRYANVQSKTYFECPFKDTPKTYILKRLKYSFL